MAEGVPPPIPPSSSAPSGNRNVMIVLAYLWLLALVPLLAEKEDGEVQWHAKHGLVLTLGEIGFWVVFNLVTVMLGAMGCLFAAFGPIALLIFVGVHVVAIVKGINGSRLIIPYVSQYAEKL
ncbi:MAG: hypothetical protein AB1635_09355 [Acidobacteriota bacterium]